MAVVAGATGLIGRFCVERLLASPRYSKVIVFTRRPMGITDPRLVERPADFDNLGASEPVDDVFCALGTTIRKAGSQGAFRRVDYDYPMKLAEWGLAAGARQFLLVSSVGAKASSSSFYLRVKGELEDELGKLPFGSLHVFRPSLLLGPREESRPAERLGEILAPALGFVLAGPLRRYRPIQAASVGVAMVEAASRGRAGRHVYHHDEIISLARPG